MAEVAGAATEGVGATKVREEAGGLAKTGVAGAEVAGAATEGVGTEVGVEARGAGENRGRGRGRGRTKRTAYTQPRLQALGTDANR